MNLDELRPTDPEKGMPETIRETLPNDQNVAGTVVVLAFDDKIEVKARGMAPRQVAKLLAEIISKII